MAKRDLVKYYKDLTAQYKEMLETFEDIQASAKDEPISEETMNELTEQMETMRINCDRLGYAVYLLQKPLFTFNKKSYDDISITDYFKNLKADKISVLNENKVALDTIKSYIDFNDLDKRLDKLDACAVEGKKFENFNDDVIEIIEDK